MLERILQPQMPQILCLMLLKQAVVYSRFFQQQVSKMFVKIKAHLSLSLSSYTTDTISVKFFYISPKNKTQLGWVLSFLRVKREIKPLD